MQVCSFSLLFGKVEEKDLNQFFIGVENETHIYKDLLTEKEWEILNLLNLGKEKKFILKNLNISKQRFSCITKNITQKIKKNSEESLPK